MAQTSSNDDQVNVIQLSGRRAQLGALDLGSNSFHLLIAQESGNRIQVLDKHKEMVRLAAGLDEDNNLTQEAIDRALDCLSRFSQRLRPLDPDNVRIVGANTLRAAKGGNFLEQAEQVLGHKIEIISGREEARLIYLGVCHDLGTSDSSRLVVDIGGGSTEVIIGRKFSPSTLESLHMGCVSMTKAHFANGKLTAKNMNNAINSAMVELEPVMSEYKKAGWDQAVGASGTINAIRSVISNLQESDEITLDALNLVRAEVEKAEKIENLNLDGLAEERKPVFPGGPAILIAIFQALQIESMTTSQGALREGCIFDLIGRQHQDDARDHTVNSLMERFSVDRAQARQVRETSIAILSQVAKRWELTTSEAKSMISWAADLHEIGMDLSHSGFHKHGAYMVENMDLPGFSKSDQRELAILIRTHRRKISPEMFAENSHALTRMSVILRIATLMHRNRSQESPPHIEASATAKQLKLTIDDQWLAQHPLTALDLEQEQAYLEPLGIKLQVQTS